MNKKSLIVCILLFSLLLLTGFALCESEWDRDPYEHWPKNDAGERANASAHRLNDGICEICLSEIWFFDDGSCDVSNYNADGDMIRYSYFEADGMLTEDYEYIFKYGADGMKVSSSTYNFGILIEESEYGTDPNGESIISKSISYPGDGTKCTSISDQYGNVISAVITGEDGSVLFEQDYAYTYDNEGFPNYTIETSRFDDGTSFRLEIDALGNRVLEIQYAADGSIIYEYHYTYEYDEHGRMIHESILEDGAPVFESFYAYSADPYDFWGYQYRTIDHMEDGSKIVCELNEMGEIIKETAYDANGNVLS